MNSSHSYWKGWETRKIARHMRAATVAKINQSARVRKSSVPKIIHTKIVIIKNKKSMAEYQLVPPLHAWSAAEILKFAEGGKGEWAINSCKSARRWYLCKTPCRLAVLAGTWSGCTGNSSAVNVPFMVMNVKSKLRKTSIAKGAWKSFLTCAVTVYRLRKHTYYKKETLKIV